MSKLSTSYRVGSTRSSAMLLSDSSSSRSSRSSRSVSLLSPSSNVSRSRSQLLSLRANKERNPKQGEDEVKDENENENEDDEGEEVEEEVKEVHRRGVKTERHMRDDSEARRESRRDGSLRPPVDEDLYRSIFSSSPEGRSVPRRDGERVNSSFASERMLRMPVEEEDSGSQHILSLLSDLDCGSDAWTNIQPVIRHTFAVLLRTSTAQVTEMKHIQTEMRLLREMRREDEGRMMRLEEELQKHRYEEQSRYQAVEERFVRFDQSLPVKFSEISKEIERSQEMIQSVRASASSDVSKAFMKDFDHLRGMVGDAMDNSAEVRRLTDHQFTLLRSDLSQLAEVEKKNRGTVREDIREELNVRLKSIHEELQTSLLDSFKKSEQQRRELVRDVDEELNSLMNRVGDIEKKENRTAEDVSKLRSGLNDLRDDVGDSFTHIQNLMDSSRSERDSFRSEMQEISSKVDTLSNHLDDMSNSLLRIDTKSNERAESLAASIHRVETAVGKCADADSVEEELSLTVSTHELERQLSLLRKEIEESSRKCMSIGEEQSQRCMQELESSRCQVEARLSSTDETNAAIRESLTRLRQEVNSNEEKFSRTRLDLTRLETSVDSLQERSTLVDRKFGDISESMESLEERVQSDLYRSFRPLCQWAGQALTALNEKDIPLTSPTSSARFVSPSSRKRNEFVLRDGRDPAFSSVKPRDSRNLGSYSLNDSKDGDMIHSDAKTSVIGEALERLCESVDSLLIRNERISSEMVSSNQGMSSQLHSFQASQREYADKLVKEQITTLKNELMHESNSQIESLRFDLATQLNEVSSAAHEASTEVLKSASQSVIDLDRKVENSISGATRRWLEASLTEFRSSMQLSLSSVERAVRLFAESTVEDVRSSLSSRIEDSNHSLEMKIRGIANELQNQSDAFRAKIESGIRDDKDRYACRQDEIRREMEDIVRKLVSLDEWRRSDYGQRGIEDIHSWMNDDHARGVLRALTEIVFGDSSPSTLAGVSAGLFTSSSSTDSAVVPLRVLLRPELDRALESVKRELDFSIGSLRNDLSSRALVVDLEANSFSIEQIKIYLRELESMITGFESHVQNFVHQGSSLSKEEFRAQLSEISKSLENVVHERDRRVDEDLRELQQRVTRCISREDLEKALRAQYSQIAQRSDTMEHSMVSLERFWKAEFKKLSDEKASAVAVEEALSQKADADLMRDRLAERVTFSELKRAVEEIHRLFRAETSSLVSQSRLQDLVQSWNQVEARVSNLEVTIDRDFARRAFVEETVENRMQAFGTLHSGVRSMRLNHPTSIQQSSDAPFSRSPHHEFLSNSTPSVSSIRLPSSLSTPAPRLAEPK